MRANAHTRRGSTLVEVVLGMAVSAVLLGALSSAMVIASKAIPDSSSPLKATADAALAIEQMADELLVATSVPTRTPNSVEFTVADRNLDGLPETIRYEWSGTTGSPLRRRHNSGLWVNILEDVRSLVLGYEVFEDISSPSTPTESGETFLAGYTRSNDLQDWAVKDKEWIGQSFVPSLPADATSWKITRVRLMARIHGANKGISRVQLRYADASGYPTGAIISEASMVEKELGSGFLWKELDISKAGGITPGARVCIVVQWIDDSDACDVLYEKSRTSESGFALLTTTNGGSTWSAGSNASMLFEVHGTYSAPNVYPPPPPTYLTGVRIKLRAGDSASSEIETRVPVRNEPRI